MATITINTEELSSEQLGALLGLLSGDDITTNGHAEVAKPAAKATTAARTKATPARTVPAKRTTRRPVEEEELVDEADEGEDELLEEAEETEEEEETAEEDDEPGLSEEDLENMSLPEVKRVATANEVTGLKPNAKKAEYIKAIMDKAEADWLASQED